MNAEFSINGRKIETKRLLLRPFAESDLDDFFEYASVEGVGEMAGWHHHESKETSRAICVPAIEQVRRAVSFFILRHPDRNDGLEIFAYLCYNSITKLIWDIIHENISF